MFSGLTQPLNPAKQDGGWDGEADEQESHTDAYKASWISAGIRLVAGLVISRRRAF